MKTRFILCVAIGSLLLASSCGKKQESVPPAQSSSDIAATGMIQKVTATAEAQTQVVSEAIQNTATNVPAQAAAASDKVQGVIDQAKRLMSENKLTEALALLNGLSGETLSADQQSLVQSLKAQIQKALDATKATGGLLPSAR